MRMAGEKKKLRIKRLENVSTSGNYEKIQLKSKR